MLGQIELHGGSQALYPIFEKMIGAALRENSTDMNNESVSSCCDGVQVNGIQAFPAHRPSQATPHWSESTFSLREFAVWNRWEGMDHTLRIQSASLFHGIAYFSLAPRRQVRFPTDAAALLLPEVQTLNRICTGNNNCIAQFVKDVARVMQKCHVFQNYHHIWRFREKRK